MQKFKEKFPLRLPFLTCRVELLGAFIALTLMLPESPLYRLLTSRCPDLKPELDGE